MITTLYSNISTTEILLECGADPNLTSEKGQTALDFAKMYNREEVASLLKSKTDSYRGERFIYFLPPFAFLQNKLYRKVWWIAPSLVLVLVVVLGATASASTGHAGPA